MASFSKLASGKTRVQVRMKGVNISASFHTKGQAQTWAREQEILIQDGKYQQQKAIDNLPTLLDLLNRYEREYIAHKKSAKNERSIFRILGRHDVAQLRVDMLKSHHIEELRYSMLQNGNKESTVRRNLTPLRHLFNVACKKWGYEIDNPFDRFDMPTEDEGRERRLSLDEEQILLPAARKHRNIEMFAMIKLAIETAMRRGELLKIEWRQVNFEKRMISLFDTKNGTNRGVPLSAEAMNVLSELAATKKDDKVFHYTGDGFRSSWKRLIDRLAIFDLRFHDLRHEATSRLFEKGLNMIEVAAITGHKDLTMLQRYTHLEAFKLAEKL